MRIFIKDEKRSLTGDEKIISFLSTGKSFTSAKAIENSDVFTIVNLLASDIASLDIEMKKDSVRESDDIAYLMNIKPNNHYSGGTLKFILTANALLNGESFCEIIRRNGKVIALAHIPNSQVSALCNEETNYQIIYEICNNKSNRKLKAEDILHFKFFTLDGLKGISPLTSLKDDLAMQKDSKRFLSNFFKNDTQTGGILKMKHGKLSKEARDKIRDEWQKSNAGVDSAHKVLVLDGTFEYEPIEVDTEILKLINATTYSTETVGKVYRIPRHKLGLETSNMSLEKANLDYLTSTLNSYLKVITNEMNFKLLNSSKQKYEFDTTPFRATDPKSYQEMTIEAFEKGLISLNEARRKLGDKPIADKNGDKHFVSLNYTTLDQIEEYQMAKAGKGGETNEE